LDIVRERTFLKMGPDCPHRQARAIPNAKDIIGQF